MFKMEYKLFLLFALGCFKYSQGQGLLTIGCPVGWVLHSTNCYKFADDELRVYEEADAYCWSFGARLVAVQSFTEHKFISDWLQSNDAIRQSQWYTSGDYSSGTLFWLSTNEVQQEPTFWLTKPSREDMLDMAFTTRVVYTFGGSLFSYSWTNVSSSTPAFTICEISRADSGKIDILDRGFDYGLGAVEAQEVERGPVVTIQPENIVILDKAANIELDCLVSGNPPATYRWYYGLQHVTAREVTSSERYTLSSGVLAVAEPKEKDVGSYHCRASNKYGSVMSDSAKVIMGFIGQFQNIDPEPVYSTAFKGTKMDCGTPSYAPGVAYAWFKNLATNIFVWPDNPNFFVSHSGALYISEVQPTDANKRYFCIVSLIATDGFKLAKAFAPSRTNKGLLLLLSSDSSSDNDYGPILNTHAFPTPALKGRTIRLECVAYGTHPLFYSWRREDGRPFVKDTELSAKNRVLTITNATLEAEGNYICTCRRGTGDSASKVISVYIEAKPYFPYPIKHMLVDPGMDITWTCKAVARPAATYTWYKNGELLSSSPGHITVRGNVLEIQDIDKDRDEGMYQCAATNPHGTTFSTGQLKVLSFPPNFKRHPLSVLTLAPMGGNITVPCDVEAAPVPEVSWLKNGGNMGLMVGDTGNRVGMTTRFGLVLEDVQFADAGVYTCQATNMLGEASNTTRLMVIQGISLTRTPNSQTVLVNRTAFFFCEASYSPDYDLTYIWRFQGRIIDYHMSPEYVTGERQGVAGLYVINAQYKNHGRYECEAKTTLHSKKASAFLAVKGPPGQPAGVYADDETVPERSVRLVWTTSEYIHHGAPINSYDVEAESNYKPGVWQVLATDIPEYYVLNEAENSAKRLDQRAFTVTDLIPNASYRFRIRAVNIYGRGKEASTPTTHEKIAATEPVLAPRNVGGGGGTVGSLTMTWEPFDISEQCGPGIGYWVYWKMKGDERDWKKSQADADGIIEGIHVETVGEDSYYLEYQVKVGAYNDLGHGPNSSVVYIYSAMGMPVSVPKILDTDTVNGTAVLINWEPVPDDREHMKGRVQGYRIHYYQDPEGLYSAFENEPDPTKVHIQFKNVYGQRDTTIAIGLTPNSNIYVRVQVFNSAGAGPKGEWRWAETWHRPLSAYPTHVWVYPYDDHSVRVRWRGVSIQPGEESLLGYIVRVYKVQEDVRSATDYKTDKTTEAIVDKLQRHNVYVLRVLGFSRAGDGAISEAVYFSVMGGSLPFDPSTTEICYGNQEERTCGSSAQLGSHVPLLLVAMLFLRVLRQ